MKLLLCTVLIQLSQCIFLNLTSCSRIISRQKVALTSGLNFRTFASTHHIALIFIWGSQQYIVPDYLDTQQMADIL